MNKGKYVFSQIMTYFPRWVFEDSVKKYKGDFHAKNLNSYSHGNLTVKARWGYSENAVKIHLWVAISTYLLLAWVKAEVKSPLTITEISKVIGASLLTKSDIRELLNVPEPLTQNQNVNELKLDF